jgi:hypothetical protein
MTYALIIVEKPERVWPDTMHRALHKMPAAEGFERKCMASEPRYAFDVSRWDSPDMPNKRSGTSCRIF